MMRGQKWGWSRRVVLGLAVLACFLIPPVSEGTEKFDLPDRLDTVRGDELALVLDAFVDREYFEVVQRLVAFEHSRGMLNNAEGRGKAFILGVLLHYGIGTDVDYAKAAKWYGVAAKNGYAFPFLGDEARKALKELQAAGYDGKETEPPPTRQEREAIAAGPEAMRKLSYRFLSGLCAPQDFDKAAKYLLLAAEGGDAEAIQVVGVSHYAGAPGFAQDVSLAVKWLSRNVDADDPRARRLLARIYTAEGETGLDDKDAEALLRTSVERGDDGAPYLLGKFYWQRKRMDEALPWLEMAAGENDAKALDLLAEIYRYGNGVQPDAEKAEEYARRAETRPEKPREPRKPFAEIAEQELGEVRVLLAALQPDWQKAGEQLVLLTGSRKAPPEAYLLLADIQEHGRCGEPNLYAAGRLYRLAAMGGIPKAMLATARLHFAGTGVRRDLPEAEKWARRAFDAGLLEADALLRDVVAALAKEGDAGIGVKRLPLGKAVADAQFRVSFRHSHPVRPEEMGVPVGWLLRSAENGCPAGQYLAGLLLLSGDARLDIAPDRERALEYLQAASAAGIEDAKAKLAAPDEGPGFWQARAAGVLAFAERARER